MAHRAWFDKTISLPESERYCTCCERELTAAFRYLEGDLRTGTYHDFGVPEAESQGWFPFGLKCARSLLIKAKARHNQAGHRRNMGD